MNQKIARFLVLPQFLYLLSLLWLSQTVITNGVQTYLTDWSYQIIGTPIKKPTKIPTTLASSLEKDGIIQNPYFRDNFLKFYEYQTKDVLYQTNISEDVIDSCSDKKIKTITFKGLDTHCDIRLNNKALITTHNMYREYTIHVEFDSNNDNVLSIRCNSSANFDIQEQAKFQQQFGFSLPQNFSFSRKAAYQYGWDWGPRILTVGIWKDVVVQCYNNIKIQKLSLEYSPIRYDNIKIDDIIVITQVADLKTGTTYEAQILITQNGRNIYNQTKKFIALSSTHKLESNRFSFEKDLAESLIWWTWDIGTPNLFNLTVSIDRVQSMTIQTGFRTVKVLQNKDQSGNGTQFTINLNGYNLFMRGGNYIPPSMSMTNISELITKYEQVRQQAIFAKYNMIRIWGGGQYQFDEFYEQMDQAGILIWHDLMFACALYPIFGSISTTDNIKEEIRDNVRRIGHHPSIGLWNGNNQVWIGWQQWGWKSGLNETQLKQAESMYKKIFHEGIPQIIQQQTPNIFYWETSPSSSSNTLGSITSGDIHFWRVWGGGTPIQQYQEYIGRFNSQYGMQSMPQISSIIQFTDVKDRSINSLILRLHERHPRGDEYLPMYTNKTTGLTGDLSRYSYYTQIMQAYALQMAIRSLRGSKPYCMGSLYWQLNDVWPVSSWATVDYYGSYKASHYRIKQLHNQLLGHVLYSKASQTYTVYAVNDYVSKISLFCQIKIYDFNGTLLKYFTYDKTCSPLQNIAIATFPASFFADLNLAKTFINVKLRSTGSQASENNYFFKNPKERFLLYPDLSFSINGKILRIKTKYLANYVWIKYKDQSKHLHLQNNFFDMLPNEQTIIQLPVALSVSEIQVTCYQCEVIKQHQNLSILQNAVAKNSQIRNNIRNGQLGTKFIEIK